MKTLITSALPYANGPLHFGHLAGSYLPADAYARFQRLIGNDVLFVCGSDEYGIAITLSAELAHRTPKEHVDRFHKMNVDLFNKLNMSFDHFSRTTWEGHISIVQEFFKDLYDNGYIEKRTEEHLYSEEENRFLADRYVMGTCPSCGFEDARGDECPKCSASFEATGLKKPRSKLTGNPLILKPSTHWYLLFDKFKGKLAKWIKQKEWKENVLNFSEKYIEDLRARSITRDSKWGVPVPLDEAAGKVLYVWFDAPIGYISASKEWAEKKGKPDAWKDYWLDSETKLVNFLGKDNIPFHSVFFPAMIMGQNRSYKIVDELPANEFLMLEGKQFSKSEGWYVDLQEFFSSYTSDQIRYTLAANAPETSDSDFSWKDFQMRCNSELLGKLGNFINRTLVFAQNNCDGKIPEPGPIEEEDERFLAKITEKCIETENNYENFRLRKASQCIMDLAQLGNAYFDGKKPWIASKDPSMHPQMNTTISCCMECIKALCLLSSPIIPEAAEKAWKLLGQKSIVAEQNWESFLKEKLASGTQLPKPKLLFRKVEDEEIISEVSKLGQSITPEVSLEPLKQMVDFDHFTQLDLRVAQVLHAEKVPKSKKLLQIQLDVGFEKRTVVSGIAKSIEPSELVGKKVILVANLKPAKIMGIESQGMILAASLNDELELPFLQKLNPGSIVS